MARPRSSKPSPSAPHAVAGDLGSLARWAVERLDRLERGAPAERAPPPWRGDGHADLVARFGLDEVEQAILAMLVALERDAGLTRRLRLWSGSSAITVELVAAACATAGLDGAIARLGPRARLRSHGLVRIPDARQRLAGAADAIALEVGIEPPAELGAELAEVTVLEPAAEVAERAPYVQRLGGKIPTIVALELSSAGTEPGVARAIADGAGRRVVAWASQPGDPEHARRLRRDVDRQGAILVVWGPMTLAALEPAPPAAPLGTPVIVVLGAVEERHVRAPFTLRRDKVAQEAPRGPLPPITEMDRIRALAQRDAERALGIIRPEPPARLVVPGRVVTVPVTVAAVPPRTAATAETARETATETVTAAATATATATEAETATQPATATAAETARETATVIATAAPTPPAEPLPDVGRVELPADAPPDLRARAAMSSPSVAQRVELLNGLAGLKSNAVVAALRHNAKSENRALREVAEGLMAQLFGANWNRSRTITPPVQPPPSEE